MASRQRKGVSDNDRGRQVGILASTRNGGFTTSGREPICKGRQQVKLGWINPRVGMNTGKGKPLPYDGQYYYNLQSILYNVLQLRK